jgi:hypothetical protein
MLYKLDRQETVHQGVDREVRLLEIKAMQRLADAEMRKVEARDPGGVCLKYTGGRDVYTAPSPAHAGQR